MKKVTLGLQIYSVREAFAREPLETLKKVAVLGYEAVELTTMVAQWDPAQIKEWFEEAGLRCCGMTTGWSYILPDKLEGWLRFNEILGNNCFVIGSAPVADLRKRDKLKDIIKTLNEVHATAKAAGFTTGYHAHYTDYFMVDGVSSWDRIMQGTPEDFSMVLDTGNMMTVNADPIHYLNKYPNRSPLVHLKPYDKIKGTSATMMGDDTFDWPLLVDTCVNVGGANTLIVENSNYQLYTPWEAVTLFSERLIPMLKEKKYM